MTPDPASYPARELLLSPDPDGPVRTVIIDRGCEPDGVMLDLFEDCILDGAHMLFAAQDRADLNRVLAAFWHVAEQRSRQ